MIKKIVYTLLICITFISCGSDEQPVSEPTGTITLNILNLGALDSGYTYEGWLITSSGPVSTGKFTSTNFPQNFTVLKSVIENASAFALSVEPANDTDEGPSDTKILSGNFNGNAASLDIDDTIGDFSNASGVFVMATPTDNNSNTNNNENGIWFMNSTNNPATAGLSIPVLSSNSGWKYEGWVIANGKPVSTGTFLNPATMDDFSPFSGNQTAPNFPGEDFLNSTVAPSGVTFPLDVRGKQVVISIEPSPDNNAAPFFLKPLEGTAGQNTTPSLNQLTLNSASFPVGTVSKN